MARISLRAYQREIEDQIENHQYDQSISHCRHILKYYPKNINTYRLLGKAYLESQRYADASDIFQRVLSSVPDDFVSHVGNSIIREDEGNLDEAIWHMERAFESQHANSAIQSELRRLHGRREGVEPPKIRLTRGALARMYLKGELFQQAIAELRAGLHEDANRHDLLVLLAQAYFASGQRVDAAEVCSKLLKALPFCFEANRILAEILSHSERAEEAKVYASRVQSLDPYAAHLSPAAPTPDKVPDAAVLLERLDWRPGIPITDRPSQPEWASTIGVDLGGETPPAEALPDWMTTQIESPIPSGAEGPEPILQQYSQPTEPEIPSQDVPIPEWMKDAGWVQASGTAEENQPISIEKEELPEELAPAEIPDWLQSIAPTEPPTITPTAVPEAESITSETEDITPASAVPWLDESPPSPSDSVVTWLESKEIQPTEELPIDQGMSEQEEVPDWLKDLEPQAPKPTLEKETQPIEEKESESIIASETGLVAAGIGALILGQEGDQSEVGTEISSGPDIGQESEPEAVVQGDVTNWLESLGPVYSEEEFEQSPEESSPETTPSGSLPDWLEELKTAGEAEVPQVPEADVEAKIPPPESEAIPAEDIPDWLREIEPLSTGEPTAETSAIEALPEVPEESIVAAVLSEDISLADEATPLGETTPLDEAVPAEEMPDWLQGLGSVEEEGTPSEMGEVPEAQLEAPPELISSLQPSEWVPETTEAESPAEIPSQVESLPEGEIGSMDEDEAFAWLEGLAVKHGAEEALILTPEDRRETPPEWVQKEVEAGIEAVTPEVGERVEVTEIPGQPTSAEPTPEWLSEEIETPTEEAVTPTLDLEAAASTPGDHELLGETPSIQPLPAAVSEDSGLGAAAVGAAAAVLSLHKEEAEGPREEPKTEMLFWPREVTPTPELVESAPEEAVIEESPVFEEDTKPTKILPVEHAVAGTAVALAEMRRPEETASQIEPVIEQSETALKTEEIPVVAEISEAEASIEPPLEGEQALEEIPTEMAVEEPPTEELPEWLRGMEETPTIPLESIEKPPEITNIPTPEEATGLDDEAAFAWLEGLAARQGVGEAMLLPSDEHAEEPPEWVLEAMKEGEGITPSEETSEGEEISKIPDWMQEGASETRGEAPKEEVQGEIPDWLKRPAIFDEAGEQAASEVTPIAPELPPWLVSIETSAETEEIPSWLPPEEATAPIEGALTPGVSTPGVEISEETPQLIDVNEAGLVELERLPGIGFIKAQAILDYRQEQGRIMNIDDLINVSGISQEDLEAIKDQIQVGAPPMEEELEQPRDENQVALLQARNALVQGDIPSALGHYHTLIEGSQMLPEVIRDINEALYRFPVDVEIWQSLGDAHSRSGHLQDALDAYTKAEEYLR